jgi:hypothetical protein
MPSKIANTKTKPLKLYHGSSYEINGPLKPVLEHKTLDHIHKKAAVFATERFDIAALFMLPMEMLASQGFEQDIPYICIWGTGTDFAKRKMKGFVYVLPSAKFKRIGKDYEWQSFENVSPIKTMHFDSAIEGMMKCGVQVYFINDDEIFDMIFANKENRSSILKGLVSENQRRKKNIRTFK